MSKSGTFTTTSENMIETPQNCKLAITEGLLRCLFTTKFVDPGIYKESLNLLAEYYGYENKKEQLLSKH
jgi:hypothetical protein